MSETVRNSAEQPEDGTFGEAPEAPAQDLTPFDQMTELDAPDLEGPPVAEAERHTFRVIHGAAERPRQAPARPPRAQGLDGDVLPPGDGGGRHDDHVTEDELRTYMLRDNPHFQALGFGDKQYFFLNRKMAVIISLTSAGMTPNNLLAIAPLSFWVSLANRHNTRSGSLEPDWTRINDFLLRESESVGLWDPKREFRQGAVIDDGDVIFHTGQNLFVNGERVPLGEHTNGYYRFTASLPYPDPAFENPFVENSPEILEFIELMKRMDWREGGAGISAMTILGYIALSAICGILKWRPHLWMDGPWGSGKSWLMEYIVMRALGSYYEAVVANTTEPGIRNALDNRATGLLFDEAEGSSKADKLRMENVMGLGRYTSSDTRAKITHSVSGGGGTRQYGIKTMMFLASITTAFPTQTDRSRWARISLGTTTRQDFATRVEAPAEELLTPDFSRRLVARMLNNATDLPIAITHMIEALKREGIVERVAKGYGVFAAGAWFALRDRPPESAEEARAFINETFGAIDAIRNNNEAINNARDHNAIYNEIMSTQLRIQTPMTTVMEPIGSLMRYVVGSEDHHGCDFPVELAVKALANIGIRPGFDKRVAKDGEAVDSFLFSRNSPDLRKILANTPYDSNYGDVMQQDSRACLGKTTLFPGNLRHRPVMVPLMSMDILPPPGENGPDDLEEDA